MRILINHNESTYFSGAERMLGYFLGLAGIGFEFAVAAEPESRMAALLPEHVRPVWIGDNHRFSPFALSRQALVLRILLTEFHLVHGWAARDWELTSFVLRITRRPPWERCTTIPPVLLKGNCFFDAARFR